MHERPSTMRFVEYLLPRPTVFWQQLRQIGIEEIVSELDRGVEGVHDNTGDQPWDFMPLARMKERYESAGLRLTGIEDWPPMDRARLGLPGAEEEIEAFCTLIKNMGRLEIPMLCYNWMGVVNWTRTRTAVPARAGALVTGFRLSDIAGAPPTSAGTAAAEQLWKALESFLHRVVPVAEAANVKLALHPDDPPIPSLRGISRIMTSVDAFDRAIGIVDSESNGICLCQGNFALMEVDVPDVIRHFGREGRIVFGHFRDVNGTATDFVENFHDQGPRDAAAAMQAWHEIRFDGMIRADHVPTLSGESNEDPGYAELGRLHAVGYLQGLRAAVTSPVWPLAEVQGP